MLTIKTMKRSIKGDRILKLDRSTLGSVIRVFTAQQHDTIVTFDKEWINEPPFGRTTISIPESIKEIRISRDLVGKHLGEEVYVNLVEKPRGYYILKVGPARFESSKKQGYSLNEFLQKWQEFQPDTILGKEVKIMANINGIDERGISYNLYLEECEYYGEEPLSYDEWLEQEEYEQEQIDRMLMTDAEKYGEED